MALMKEQISVIRNDFLGIGWNANKIWKEHPTFNWSRIAVYDLLQKVKEIESGEQWKGSGWPVSATTKQIANDCELLVRSQEEGPGTQFSIIKITTQKGISNLSVQPILQKCKSKAYKRVSSTHINETIPIVTELKDQANCCNVSMIAVYHS